MDDTPSLASDHALLLSAICAGRAKWEPITAAGYAGRIIIGRVYFWVVTIDYLGCPVLGEQMREALRISAKPS